MRGKRDSEFESERGTVLLLSTYSRAFPLRRRAGEADVVLDRPVVWERVPIEKLVQGEVGGPDEGPFPVLLLRLRFVVYLEDETRRGPHVATTYEENSEYYVLTERDVTRGLNSKNELRSKRTSSAR